MCEVRTMGSRGFIIRMLPFVAAFSLGLFIASFFVNVGRPAFAGRSGRGQELKRLRMENEDLRNENLRLKNDLDNFRWSLDDKHGLREMEMRIDVPAPPPPPVIRRK